MSVKAFQIDRGVLTDTPASQVSNSPARTVCPLVLQSNVTGHRDASATRSLCPSISAPVSDELGGLI